MIQVQMYSVGCSCLVLLCTIRLHVVEEEGGDILLPAVLYPWEPRFGRVRWFSPAASGRRGQTRPVISRSTPGRSWTDGCESSGTAPLSSSTSSYARLHAPLTSTKLSMKATSSNGSPTDQRPMLLSRLQGATESCSVAC